MQRSEAGNSLGQQVRLTIAEGWQGTSGVWRPQTSAAHGGMEVAIPQLLRSRTRARKRRRKRGWGAL
jgi:hypothetical protein